MPITVQPPRDVVPIYRPVQFECFFTGNANLVIQNAVVELFYKGVSVSTFRVKYTRNTPSVFPGITEYYFIIDVAEKLQDLTAPFTSLPSVFEVSGGTQPADNSDMIADFYLSITYEGLDLNTGLISPVGAAAELTNVFFGASITRQHLEEMYLDDYTQSFPAGKNLTNSPKEINICREDNQFLSALIAPASVLYANAYKITLLDSAGGVIGDAVGLLPTTPDTGHIVTINVGIENGLKGYTYVLTSPGFDLDDTNINCYTVEIGLLNLGVFTAFREPYTYCLTGCECCERRRFRLHWLNCLGGVDSYTFCSIKELSQQVTNVTAEKGLNWDPTSLTPNNIQDVGKFKTRSENNLIYRVVSRDLSNNMALWLAEMLGSVKTYVEIDGELVPVIIQDVNQVISRQSGKIKFELSILRSDCIIKHRV